MTDGLRITLDLAALGILAALVIWLHLAHSRRSAEHYRALSAQIGCWMDETRAAHAAHGRDLANRAPCPSCPARDIAALRTAAEALRQIADGMTPGAPVAPLTADARDQLLAAVRGESNGHSERI